ncbi:MAG: twin-arginine translocation pathway signal protein [Proteobacteria bacterium]|nr:twin-arginine translocation pathway signal protein [Pseudomonadota bacterium]NIS69768.1 twin-arginine translocation pathway signal protein [Pseudomonadota bacterium]
MNKFIGILLAALVVVTAIVPGLNPRPAIGATAAEIDRNVDSALKKLYASTPKAKELSKVAKGILVFPNVVKAGLIVGGQYGEGALRVGGNTVGYYNTVEASYGLQAGGQSFGYALFFMNDSALEYFENSAGFEIGSGPTVVLVDEGLAKSLSTSTIRDDIYALIFGQKGLMAGIGLRGSKISKITPAK